MLQVAHPDFQELSNPKLGSDDRSREFYRYYAGFSESFARDAIDILKLGPNAIILDPWNGAGTTTTVAAERGLQSIGVDLNPALTIVAKARSADISEALNALSVFEKEIRNLDFAGQCIAEDDSLLRWFGHSSAAKIRKVEQLILDIAGFSSSDVVVEDDLSAETALLYVLLFRVTKQYAQKIAGSNPTWIRKTMGDRRLAIWEINLRERLRKEIEAASDFMNGSATNTDFKLATIRTASSTDLGFLPEMAVDAVITSPPYCTRIDYAIATSLELALISKRFSVEFDNLREQLIGTTLTRAEKPDLSDMWGENCIEFLSGVENHKSKASGTYYYRYYRNYFYEIYRSLNEISRVAKNEAWAIFVVQDSYYKDIRLDLAEIYVEMLSKLGWGLWIRKDFATSATFTRLNPNARLYEKTERPTETILVLQKS